MISAQTIAGLFTQVIGTTCGPDTNFFDAGGDSIHAEQVMISVSEIIGRELPISSLLDYQTPAELAAYLAADPQARQT